MAIDLGSAKGTIEIDASGVERGIAQAQKSLGRLGAGMTLAIGTALAAVGKSALDTARHFEDSMAVMSVAVDPVTLGVKSTSEAMDILSKASLRLGSDTQLVGVSATSAADAITGLYKAGLSTGEIFGDLQGYMAGTAEAGGALRASIDLAAASELTVAQTSDLAATALATFGGDLTTAAERSDFVNKAMNNFVQTADASLASVQDLADAFTNIGATAAGMGVPLADVNTALGILSSRGIAGADAGTAIKSMLTNMMTAPKAAKALDRLGVSLYDVNGQMRPLADIIADLETAMAGMTDEQRTQTVVALASSYGQKALNALLAEGATGWANMETAIAGAATIQETAAARANTLSGAVEMLKSAWQSISIQMAMAKFPALTELIKSIAELVTNHGPALLRILSLVFGALAGLMIVIKVASAIKTLAIVWGAVTAAVGSSAGAISGIVALLGGPVTLVVAAVVAAVALLATAWAKDWGGIREKTAAAIAAIKKVIQAGLDFIRAIWARYGEGITAVWQRVWGAVSAYLRTTWANIRSVLKIVTAIFRGDWEEVGVQLRQIWERSWAIIVNVVRTIGEEIIPALDALARKIYEWWQSIDWAELGRKILEGIGKGLNSNASLSSSAYASGQRAREQFLAGWDRGEAVTADDIVSPEALRDTEQNVKEAAKDVARSAALADRAMLGYADAVTAVGDASVIAADGIDASSIALRLQRYNFKLEPLDKYADGMARLTDIAAGNKAAVENAAAAVERYASAFSSVQADYTTELPRADKPLVTPEQTVSVVTQISGPTAEQTELATRYQAELEKLHETYIELTGGVGTFGMEQDKLDAKINETAGEIAHYEGLLANIPPAVNDVSTSQQGLTVNVDAVRQGIYDQLVEMQAAPEIIAAYAAATGIMSAAQAEAVLQAAAVKVKIDELAQSIANGMPIDQALADLDAFISKIETGVNPAAATLATEVPARVTEMKDAMSAEALAAGGAVTANIATGINDNLSEATTAATDAADAVAAAVREAHGIESPSHVFADIGAQDIAGFVAGVEDAQGDAVSAMETVAQAAVDAWDETIDAADGIGVAIMDGVIAGVESRRGALIAKMQEIARAAYQAAMAELDAHSPSRVFMQMGAAIIEGVIAGLDATQDALYAKLLDIASKLSSIGQDAFGRQTDALEARLGDSTDRLTEALNGLRGAFGNTAIDNLLDMNPKDRAYYLRTLRGESAAGNMLVREQLEAAVRLADERNGLEQEYIRQQQELAALERQRSQLDFLKQQADLLDLIRENGLSANILEGLTLGLDANMSDVIAAMTEAVRQLIERANDELQIASPSGVFRQMGTRVMDGLAEGLGKTREVEARMRAALGRLQMLGAADVSRLQQRLQSELGQSIRVDARGLGLNQNVVVYGGVHVPPGSGKPADPLRELYFANLAY